MKRRLVSATFLLLFGVISAVSQVPIRDLNQIREETSQRNRAIEDYDRRNPNRINSPISRRQGLNGGGKIPNSEIRKYVLAAQAETEVKVLKVGSGDTLLVDDGTNKVSVHILGIDAPENGQAFYEEAKKNLSELLTGKKVVLKYSLHNLKDEFGYFPARVFIGGSDVGLSILENGFAWRDENDKFFFEKDDDRRNEQAETKAQTAKLGIWKDEKPQSPQKYREQKLKESKKTQQKAVEK